MDDVALARALHVLAVVVWIGGVAMVTLAVLPAIRRGELGPDRLAAFKAIERRFSWHARIAVLIVGLTGFYMLARFDVWDRFRTAEFWWMHAMVAVWTLFALLLFVIEPLAAHRWFGVDAAHRPDAALWRLQRAHWVLLGLSVLTILGAVAGSHGLSIFWPA